MLQLQSLRGQNVNRKTIRRSGLKTFPGAPCEGLKILWNTCGCLVTGGSIHIQKPLKPCVLNTYCIIYTICKHLQLKFEIREGVKINWALKQLTLKPCPRIYWRESLVLAAAVIHKYFYIFQIEDFGNFYNTFTLNISAIYTAIILNFSVNLTMVFI